MQTSQREHILIVDDEPDVRRVIERSLRRAGYRRIAHADSVGLAREKIAAEGPFALVVLDILMPGEPGTNLLHELAGQAPDTVVIVATGVAAIQTAVHALKAGAYDYLVKPLIPEGVQLAVGRALRRRWLEIEERKRRDHIAQLVEERTAVLERTRRALLESLCDMAEFRHAETGAHLRRVPAYARAIAGDMARRGKGPRVITSDFVEHLSESAPLHDIGKVAVPYKILLKPGPLDAEEFEQVKEHTTIGARMCESVKARLGEESAFIDMAIDVTRSHHERWDGEGYPAGTAEWETPLCGQIVHLVDFYDACRSPRVYRREPIPRDEVVEMIEQGGGAQFAPDLVEAFLRLREEFAELEEGISDLAPV
jgi:putative two-component system response regulator